MDTLTLARARLHVVDVLRIANRRLNAAGYHAAADLLTDYAFHIAAELARERAQEQTEEGK